MKTDFRTSFLNFKTFPHDVAHFSEIEIPIFVYIRCQVLQ